MRKIILISCLLILLSACGKNNINDKKEFDLVKDNFQKSDLVQDHVKNESVKKKFSFDKCNKIGAIEGLCECLEITGGWGLMWLCDEEIKCGDNVMSLELFKKRKCQCVFPEMPRCSPYIKGITKCGGFFCENGDSIEEQALQSDIIEDSIPKDDLNKEISRKKCNVEKMENISSGDYLGNYCKGNYVWGGAMNLAWNELGENILYEKLKMNTEDEIALEMVKKFNNEPFSRKDLDEESCYIKSGYGQETVNIINRESREKFPQKSFDDLKIELPARGIISYAYFFKEVEYEKEFEEKNFKFNGEMVKGFYAADEHQKENVQIIKYESDDQFIISLKLKDQNDQIILAKGYNMEDPQIVVDEIKNNKDKLSTIRDIDRFQSPELHLDYHRDYVELIRKFLANPGFETYFISKMYENIKFDMDKKGARVENEAVIALLESVRMTTEEPRNFILNKPYWVIMKRADSDKPYFILGINNTELMKKK